ncbi:MAG: hypothetical protein Q9184_005495 [Pyrenodesmia sp. 2 TL-2023]
MLALRYKFKNQTLDLELVHRPAPKSGPQPNRQDVIEQPSGALSNGLSSLSSAFVHCLSQKVDIRFQLLWNFGDYLTSIPCRLGVSAALDAAVDALVAAHSAFCVGNLVSNPVVWRKYSRALSVLRHDLDDVVKARSAESLCAVMLNSIVQLLLDPSSDELISHTQGAARLMKSRGFVEPSDQFERNLMNTLRGPVVFDALLTDKIQFSSREWNSFIGKGLGPQDSPAAQWLNCIAAVPDLLQRSKAALKLCEPPSLHTLSLELETRSLLEKCTTSISTLRERLQAYDPISTPAELRDHLHALHLRSLGLALSTGILLNCVLSGLEGTSNEICEESSSWSDEIFHLSKLATKYRPLGAMAMGICLKFAWMGAASADARERVEALLIDYCLVCLGSTKGVQYSDLMRMKRRFMLQDV